MKETGAKLSKTARASALKKGSKGRVTLCKCGEPLFGVLLYPSLGNPINAWGCNECNKVWKLEGKLLVENVAFAAINWGKK